MIDQFDQYLSPVAPRLDSYPLILRGYPLKMRGLPLKMIRRIREISRIC